MAFAADFEYEVESRGSVEQQPAEESDTES